MAQPSFLRSIGTVVLGILVLSMLPGLINKMRDWYGSHIEQKVSVAVIDVKGVLYDSSKYIKQLNTFFKDDKIKAIVLKIECPGSAAGTGQLIHNEILTLKALHPKPIISFVENICASGGYYIASATDHIIAPGSSLVGSIGVAFPYLFQLKEFIEQYKVKTVPLKAGTYKIMGDPFKDITPEEKALLEGVLNDSYQQFAEDVARARGLEMSTLTEWADGKIFTGRQALALKLIDRLGSATDVVTLVKEKGGFTNEINWVRQAKQEGLLSRMLSGGDDDSDGSMFQSFFSAFGSFLEQRFGSHIIL